MKSLKKTVLSDFKSLATKLDTIIATCNDKVTQAEGFEYKTSISGRLTFYRSGSQYSFETLDEFREALSLENVDDIWLWSLDIAIEETPKGKSYPSTAKIDLSFGIDVQHNGIEVDISKSSFSFARGLIDEIVVLLDASYFTMPEIDHNEVAETKMNEERRSGIEKSIDILERLPEFQARISNELSSEKEVQDFLFPILKSHFPSLQEEDYLSKVAGGASKPDFGIEDLGIAYEVKYTSRSATFKKLGDEISIDSRKYFGKGSPFKNLIVIIYNGSQEATPANYIADLEHIDVISKVVISPKIVPKLK